MLCLRDAHSGQDDGAAHSSRCPQSNRSWRCRGGGFTASPPTGVREVLPTCQPRWCRHGDPGMGFYARRSVRAL
jgi:hypothetical protein